LHTIGGDIRYDAQGTLMTIGGWRLYQIPLYGGAMWTMTPIPGATFTDVQQLEIHHDTQGAGFTIYVDGVTFGGPLTGVYLSPDTSVGRGTSSATVTLPEIAAADTLVYPQSSDPSIATVPQIATVPAGSSSVSFPVTTNVVAATSPVTISVSWQTTTWSAPLTVNPVPINLSSGSLAPNSVVGGSPSTGTVTLTAPAAAGGFVVTLSSSNTAAATVPASVTVASGATTATFTVTSLAVASSTSVTITGVAAGVTQTAVLTVTPAALSAVSVAPASVVGGNNSTGTVTLTGPAPAGGVVVTLSSSVTSAATVPASVTVA